LFKVDGQMVVVEGAGKEVTAGCQSKPVAWIEVGPIVKLPMLAAGQSP
jgi:hypothetical protein